MMNNNTYDIIVTGPLTVCHNHEALRIFYDNIAALCKKIGYKVYTAHNFTDPYKNPEIKSKDIYIKNNKIISSVRLMLAYVGTPSIGTGTELEIAAEKKIPVILLYEKEAKISRMALGNPSVIDKILFSDFNNALNKIESAIKKHFKNYD